MVAGAGCCVAGAACFVAGVAAFVCGAGVSGTADPPVGAAFTGAGAAAAGGANVWSSTERGARLRVDISVRTNERPRKMPPPHQLAFVNRLPACRVPRSELAELLTPPKVAAMPPP